MGPFVGVVEIAGETLLLPGLLTRLAARTDFCMLLGPLFLLIIGAGCPSLDALIARRRSRDDTAASSV
jgi:uncharacterized membrane protein YphA (DoxX/SURF4 family)